MLIKLIVCLSVFHWWRKLTTLKLKTEKYKQFKLQRLVCWLCFHWLYSDGNWRSNSLSLVDKEFFENWKPLFYMIFKTVCITFNDLGEKSLLSCLQMRKTTPRDYPTQGNIILRIFLFSFSVFSHQLANTLSQLIVLFLVFRFFAAGLNALIYSLLTF